MIAVEYPSSFESDTFLHAAIAHEVGHIALVVGGWDDKIWTEQRVKYELEDASAIAQRKLWEELACDFLGVHLIGPAYALAFLEYSFAANLWKRPMAAEHPDLAWRVSKLKDAVAALPASARTVVIGHDSSSPDNQQVANLLGL